MAYYAQQEGSNYAVFNDQAQRVSTTSADGLVGYGLSTTNLGSAAPVAQGIPVQPTSTGTQQPVTPAVTKAPPPPLPDELYSSVSSAVGSGIMTAAQAQNYLQSYISSGEYGGSIDTSKLFPTGTTYTTDNGQQVQFDNTGTGSTVSLTPTTNVSATNAQGMPLSQIGSTVTPPSSSGTYSPPAATAPSVADSFNTTLSATVTNMQNALATSLSTQSQNYQTQIDQLNTQNESYQSAAELGLSDESSVVSQESQQKQAALDQENAEFQENYTARQNLVGQLQTLLTQGQTAITQMQGTTGLSSIMTPRIASTLSNVQAQAGVITAALSAYDTQIGLAQTQLKSATDAITSIYGDQISYYQSVVSFYENSQSENDKSITTLSADQKTYIDAQIKDAQDAITTAQSNADAFQKAFLDPTTALAYAKAGVTLTDSAAQIASKLLSQATAEGNQYTAPFKLGNDWVQKDTQTGEIKSVVSAAAPASQTYTFTPTLKTQLLGTGETSASIDQLQSDIGKYGAQYVLDNGQGLSDATKQVIETEFNIQPTPTPSAPAKPFNILQPSTWI